MLFMIQKLGVQLFTVRDFMKTEEDVRATFRKLKAIGYDQAQTAGCAIPYETFGRLAREEGIEIVGTHDNFDMMLNDFDQAYRNHQALGTNIMGIGGFFGKTPEETARDYGVKSVNRYNFFKIKKEIYK